MVHLNSIILYLPFPSFVLWNLNYIQVQNVDFFVFFSKEFMSYSLELCLLIKFICLLCFVAFIY